MMSTSDIRNKVIDQIMSIKDGEFLRALSDMIDRARVEEKAVQLTEEQKLMLTMSEEDIAEGRTIDQITLTDWDNRQDPQKLLELLKRVP